MKTNRKAGDFWEWSKHVFQAAREKWLLRSSIKEGVDNLPCGIAFARPSGLVILCNHAMHKLSQELTGEQMLNARAFWIRAKSEGVLTGRNTYTVHLPNQEIWSISCQSQMLENEPIFALEAQNVTEIYALNDQLQQDNQRLDAMTLRLRRYNRNAAELGKQRELLERRILIHDELGRLLTRSRYYLSGGTTDAHELWEAWKLNASLMLQDAKIQEEPLCMQIQQTAHAVGVEVLFSGDIPQNGIASEILMHAAGEALTNMLRHAHGQRLELSGLLDKGWFVFKFCNDGDPPEGPVLEGGGLSALRYKTEEAGGIMYVHSSPSFCLEIRVPQRGNENVSHFDCGR